MSLWTDNIIETIENYGPDLLRQIDESLQAVTSGATGLVLQVPLVLAVANMDRYEDEFERVFGTF
jgi:hypothetical protein